jgi:rubrerythrin
MHPTTKRNLTRALEREAVAAARLIAYAKGADADQDPEAARTLRAIARMDLSHAAEMAELLGWVGSLQENVLDSVVGDAPTHGLNYATFAADARHVGDGDAAQLFTRLTADETEAAIGLLALASRRHRGGVGTRPDAATRRPAPDRARSPRGASTIPARADAA